MIFSLLKKHRVLVPYANVFLSAQWRDQIGSCYTSIRFLHLWISKSELLDKRSHPSLKNLCFQSFWQILTFFIDFCKNFRFWGCLIFHCFFNFSLFFVTAAPTASMKCFKHKTIGMLLWIFWEEERNILQLICPDKFIILFIYCFQGIQYPK